MILSTSESVFIFSELTFFSNAICESTRKNKSAELLAKYSDSILKKSNKVSEDTDVDKTLSDIVSIE